jgi:hypothetical protein
LLKLVKIIISGFTSRTKVLICMQFLGVIRTYVCSHLFATPMGELLSQRNIRRAVEKIHRLLSEQDGSTIRVCTTCIPPQTGTRVPLRKGCGLWYCPQSEIFFLASIPHWIGRAARVSYPILTLNCCVTPTELAWGQHKFPPPTFWIGYPVERPNCSAELSLFKSFALWHQCLGHLGRAKFKTFFLTGVNVVRNYFH